MIHDSVREAMLSILPAAMDMARRHGLPAEYRSGNRPRHVAGNLKEPSAVRVILLLAEPGSSPGAEELNRDEATWLDDITCDGLGHGGFRLRYDGGARSLYEVNPREFIKLIWPAEPDADRMKKVIITNSFWMQALASGGSISAPAVKEFCGHLKKFISVFPNAVVVAAGRKASDRCLKGGISAIHMGALTPPGCYQYAVRTSWQHAVERVRQKLGLR